MKTIDLRTPGPSGDTGAGTGPGAGRLILLDVPAELVDRFESGSGGTLTIRGREDDTAVLVTSDSTYAVRSVSQSNSLLLCQATNAATLSIAANVAEYMELVPTVPRLERIHSLLRDSRYTGDDTKLHGPDVVSYERLAREVQASDAQLATGLVQAHVVHLDGAMRQLDPEFTQTLLRALLAHIDLNAYLPSSVPVDETVAALEREHALNPTVTRAVLTSFFGSSADAETDSAALDLPAVARFFGIQCLKRARHPVPLNDFVTNWKDTLPEHAADLSLLRGEYILHPAPPAAPTHIQRYAKADLPTDPAARFQELFLTRPSWLAEDLDPFIADLAPGGSSKKKDALLLKFTRATKNGAQTMYSARVKY